MPNHIVRVPVGPHHITVVSRLINHIDFLAVKHDSLTLIGSNKLRKDHCFYIHSILEHPSAADSVIVAGSVYKMDGTFSHSRLLTVKMII